MVETKSDPLPPLTAAEVAEAKRLCEQAREGPWKRVHTHGFGTCLFADEEPVVSLNSGYAHHVAVDDAAFIAASRTLLPRLLSEVERVRAARNPYHGDGKLAQELRSEGTSIQERGYLCVVPETTSRLLLQAAERIAELAPAHPDEAAPAPQEER